MLRTIKYLEGYAVDATDGAIGRVGDFYFDDQSWVVRYLIVDTGIWLGGRKVLVSPIAVRHADWTLREMHVALTKEQVIDSPDIDTARPVSRQHEMLYSDYYGYPYYWDGAGYLSSSMYASSIVSGYGSSGSPHGISSDEGDAYPPQASAQTRDDDPHLRSCRAVMKYHVHAIDGDVGHVEDLLIDDETWAIRFLIVNTGNWWLGHKVLVAPQWIQDINWRDAKVSVKVTRESIQEAPAYDPTALLGRTQELHRGSRYGHATGDQAYIDAEQIQSDEQGLDDDADADEQDALTSGASTPVADVPEQRDVSSAARDGRSKARLHDAKDLEGYVVDATDGPIGHVRDFFFDDRAWIVRYVVVETGSWLRSRKVLISPAALRSPDWTAKLLPVGITKEQVRNSPNVDTEVPVSRQHEVQFADYYGHPHYWEEEKRRNADTSHDLNPPGYDAIGSVQAKRAERAASIARATPGSETDNPHLRSCRAVMRYLVRAKDGNIGEVGGMLLDDATWAISYLIVSTSEWFGGRRVLVAAHRIDRVSWTEAAVYVEMTRQAIKDAPTYDPAVRLDQ